MAEREVLEKLLARVEASDGPDRLLDFAIHEAFFPPPASKLVHPEVELPPGFGRDFLSLALDPRPVVTGSIDAAMALAETLRFGRDIDLETRLSMSDGVVARHCDAAIYGSTYSEGEKNASAWGFTVPLAILAALLRSLIAESKP